MVVEAFEVKPFSVRMGEGDHPFRRQVKPGDAVEDGGLAGAVRADQSGDILASGFEGHIVDGDETAKTHGQMLDLEDWVLLPGLHERPHFGRKLKPPLVLSSRIDGVREETIPRGRQIMMATMARPNRSMR